MSSIPRLEIEPCFSKPLIAAIEALNKRAAAHNARAAAHSEKVASLSSADAGAVDADLLFDAPTIRERFEILREEAAIRNDLADLLKRRRQERRQDVESHVARIDQVREELVKKLHKLGFAGDGIAFDATVQGCLIPGQIAAHPAMARARAEAHEASNHAEDKNDDSANGEALASIMRQLRAARESAATLVGAA